MFDSECSNFISLFYKLIVSLDFVWNREGILFSTLKDFIYIHPFVLVYNYVLNFQIYVGISFLYIQVNYHKSWF